MFLCFLSFVSAATKILCFSDNESICPRDSELIDEYSFYSWEEYLGNTIKFYVFKDFYNETEKLYIDLNIRCENSSEISFFGNNSKIFFKNKPEENITAFTKLLISNCVAEFESETLTIYQLLAFSSKLASGEKQMTINSERINTDIYSYTLLNVKMVKSLWFYIKNLDSDVKNVSLPRGISTDVSVKDIRTDLTFLFYFDGIKIIEEKTQKSIFIETLGNDYSPTIENINTNCTMTLYWLAGRGSLLIGKLKIVLGQKSFLVLPQEIIKDDKNSPVIDVKSGAQIKINAPSTPFKFERGTSTIQLSYEADENSNIIEGIPVCAGTKTSVYSAATLQSKEVTLRDIQFSQGSNELEIGPETLRANLDQTVVFSDTVAKIYGAAPISFNEFFISGITLKVNNAAFINKSGISMIFTDNAAPSLQIEGNIEEQGTKTLDVILDQNYQHDNVEQDIELVCAKDLKCETWNVNMKGMMNTAFYGKYNYTKDCATVKENKCLVLKATESQTFKGNRLCISSKDNECPTLYYRTTESELPSNIPSKSNEVEICIIKTNASIDLSKVKLTNALLEVFGEGGKLSLTPESLPKDSNISIDALDVDLDISGDSDFFVNDLNIHENNISSAFASHLIANDVTGSAAGIPSGLITFKKASIQLFDSEEIDVLLDDGFIKVSNENNTYIIKYQADGNITIEASAITSSINIQQTANFTNDVTLIVNATAKIVGFTVETSTNFSKLWLVAAQSAIFDLQDNLPIHMVAPQMVINGNGKIGTLELDNDNELIVNGRVAADSVKFDGNVKVDAPSLTTSKLIIETSTIASIPFNVDSAFINYGSDVTFAKMPKSFNVRYNLQAVPAITVPSGKSKVNAELNYITLGDDPYKKFIDTYNANPIPIFCGKNADFSKWNVTFTSENPSFNGDTSVLHVFKRKFEGQNCLAFGVAIPTPKPTPFPTNKPTPEETPAMTPNETPTPSLDPRLPSPTFAETPDLTPLMTPLQSAYPTPSESPSPSPVPFVKSTTGIAVFAGSGVFVVACIFISIFLVCKKKKESGLYKTLLEETIVSKSEAEQFV